MLDRLKERLGIKPPRRLGWRPSTPDARDYGIDRLGLSAHGLPEHPGLLPPFWTKHFDQGPTSSCTGNATSAAMCMLERYTFRDGSRRPPSRSALYFNGRSQTLVRQGSHGPVSDDGAFLRDVFDALRKLGCPDEADAPFVPSKINAQPPIGAYLKGHARRGGSYVRVQESGTQKSLAIRAALAAGYPVVIGTPVAETFLDNDGPDIIDRPGNEPIAGGHALVLSDYDTGSPSGPLYRVENSWGDGWREDGAAWFTEAYVQWPSLEAWIVYSWEGLR